jgi:uncharacterized membrane protein
MRTWLNNLWESLRSSLWFVPLTVILLFAGLGFLTTFVEERFGEAEFYNGLKFLYRSGAGNSLAILTTIAGSVMTVASVSFSITIVALTLASSQFGPRLLRTFTRSFTSQAIIGAFTGIFVYCLIVMRSVGTSWEEGRPHLSITVAVGLGLLSVCLLIYFVHHVASSIQADNLVAQVHAELEAMIESLPKLGEDDDAVAPHRFPSPSKDAVPVLSPRSGYLQAIDGESMSDCADKGGYRVIFAHRPGGFVIKGSPLAWLEGAEAEQDRTAIEAELIRDVYLGRARSPEQDLEYALSQLVEIGLRALSPGINDPKTAEICIDHLVADLCQLADREVQGLTRKYGRARACVFVPDTSFEGIVDEAFNRIRQNCDGQPSVIIRLIDGLTRLAARLQQSPERREAVVAQMRQIEEGLSRLSLAEKDRAEIEARVKAFHANEDGRSPDTDGR